MTSLKARGAAPQYPPPLVIQPTSGTHLQSFLILHGRGSNGEKFGLEMIQTTIPGFETLPDAFPNAKFVFPTAAKRRAVIYKRTPVSQWFDNYHLNAATEREELQFDGLRQSASFVHELMQSEIATVGAENVILWGLSQGCAMSLISSLLWHGPRFAAVIGMCGWLPLRKRIEDSLLDESREQDDDPFGRDSTEQEKSSLQEAIEYLREELEISGSDASPESTATVPRFLGHGTEDDRVPIKLGREAAQLLRRLELNVSFKEYEGLGHWYSPQMLTDIIEFIESSTGWKAKRAEGTRALPKADEQI
ncbi:Acyl- thioesterase [Lecanosticta acicola]|uniref:Acyl- thioesterase n=1 Tax=Lecanosticta acicola TaxID=111012 RepID=A0AAI9E6L3_9PEZI|nr:Acyl- thioesterase [Lecanosticta acicola]